MKEKIVFYGCATIFLGSLLGLYFSGMKTIFALNNKEKEPIIMADLLKKSSVILECNLGTKYCDMGDCLRAAIVTAINEQCSVTLKFGEHDYFVDYANVEKWVAKLAKTPVGADEPTPPKSQ